jgi:hypothetical protein
MRRDLLLLFPSVRFNKSKPVVLSIAVQAEWSTMILFAKRNRSPSITGTHKEGVITAHNVHECHVPDRLYRHSLVHSVKSMEAAGFEPGIAMVPES